MPTGSIKTPLVLIPGLLCNKALWRHQISGLADIADTWVADTTLSNSMADIASHILASVPFERFALAGLSMGGYVVFEMWRRAPERIIQLGLFSTSARPDTPDQVERRRDLIELAKRGRFIGVSAALLPLLVHADRQRDPVLVETVKRMAKETGGEAFIRQEQAIMHRINSVPDLARIACPSLILCGREDVLTPLDRHEEMAMGISGAQLQIVERCGHLSPLEQPDIVNAAMRAWLVGPHRSMD
jgi:pimeloyl-ACP methyl ester carboxylesterase